ncbi:uncharacterized protein MYCGRDRAFT_78052, partial [Zymoseptoria tritici IPO323]
RTHRRPIFRALAHAGWSERESAQNSIVSFFFHLILILTINIDTINIDIRTRALANYRTDDLSSLQPQPALPSTGDFFLLINRVTASDLFLLINRVTASDITLLINRVTASDITLLINRVTASDITLLINRVTASDITLLFLLDST